MRTLATSRSVKVTIRDILRKSHMGTELRTTDGDAEAMDKPKLQTQSFDGQCRGQAVTGYAGK